MKRIKKKFDINIWDFIDVEDVNEELDELLKYKYVPSDIGYKILKITKDGKLTLEADFERLQI